MKNSVVLYNVSTMLNSLLSTISPIKYIITLVAIFVATANLSAQTYNGDTWYSLYETAEHEIGTSLIGVPSDWSYSVFPPTQSTLTFEAKKQTLGGGDLCIYPIYNGSQQGYIFSENLSKSWKTKSCTLTQEQTIKTTEFRFDRRNGVTLRKYFKNVKLPLAKHILLNDNTSNGQTWGVSSITLTDNSLATAEGKTSTSAYTIRFRSFLANGNITITSNNKEFHFDNGATSISLNTKNNYFARIGGTVSKSSTNEADHRNVDEYETKVYFSPSVKYNKDNRSTTITITDGKSTAYIYLSAPVIPTYFFKAEAIASPAEGGTATATFANGQNTYSIIAPDYATANMSAAVTFTAAPNTANGYVFEGWKTDPANSTFYKQGADQTSFTETITSSALNPTGLASQKTYYAIYSRRYTAKITGSNYTGKLVNDSWKADYQFINTQTEKPTNSEADPFYFKIEHNFTGNDTREGSPRPNEVIAYDPATDTITALNEGVATITFYQKNTDSHEPVTQSFTVEVNKYTPTFTWNAGNSTYYYLSSIANIFDTSNDDFGYSVVSDNEHVAKVIDNTLHIYNVEETANITVTQAENYKWNGKTETYTITPENPNNHVTFTYTQAMFNDGTITTQKVSQYGVEWTSDNQLRLGGSSKTVVPGQPAYDWEDKYVVIHFEGIPKDISFKYKANTSNVSNGATALKRADWYIAEGVEGANGEIVWSEVYPWANLGGDKSNSTSWETVSNKPLQSTTRYLKLCYSGNFAGYYSDIVVTELEKFEAGPKTLDFGTQSVNFGQQEKQVVFEHANIGRETTVTIEGADKDFFSVSPTTISNTGRDLYGTAYLNVTFDNGTTVRGDKPYNATLVITDNAGHREEVLLTGIRNGKATPVFTWNPNNFPYYFNTSIANIVVSSNTDYANCPLRITSSNENIAKVENGRLYINHTSGEVTFTVTQGGNDSYYEHTETFTFTPKAKPDLEVPFQVTQTIYNQAITVGENCSWDGDGHQLKLGNGAWDDTRKTAILVFSGRPDKLTFSYATSYDLAVIEIGSFGKPKWEVEESSDGENWQSIWSVRTNSTNWADAEIQLSETTQYVRFSYDGNYAGYFKNINISELVGYKYLRAADGQYLSRGAKWGTQAVVDAFGVVARISRYTQDNENIYTRFFFVDNEQYMFETETDDDQRLHEVFTDNGTALNTNHLWQINDNGGILTIQSANEVGAVSHKGNYIAAVNGVLAFTTNEAEATQWQMEDYTEHPQYITDMLNRQAANAAVKDFGTDINTLEKVRNRLKVEDFETHEITIPALGEQTGEGRTLEGMPHIYEQTITGLDTGFYRLTVKALYRISNSEIAWKCNQEKGKESVLAYAYANNVQYPIQSVYASYHSSAYKNTDELHDGKYYSTTLTSAEVAFNDANRYLNDVYVYVAPDPDKTTGTLRYGIKCPSYVPGAWLAYENITLTHFKRKEFIFEGKDDINTTTTPTQWTEQYNWNRDLQPNQYHVAIIQANVIIDTEVSVHSMIIDTTFNPDVTVTIAPNGGLTVGSGGVKGATTDNFIIKASTEGATKGQTGYIRISPYTEQSMPSATMEMYSKAYFDMTADDRNNVGSWQYVGSPMAEAETLARSIYKSSWIYNWNDSTAEWENNRKTLILKPFEGYCTSQYKYPDGMLITNTGQLASNGNVELNLTYTGDADTLRCNVFANSYAAPIDITQFTTGDFSEGVEATINLFNTGSKNNIADQVGKTDLDAPGQYIAIPVATAADLVAIHKYPAVIPAMQGFFVNTTKPGTLKLNYERLVWNADYTKHANAPLRTKERSTTTGALCVSIEADGWRDNLYLLEAEKYDANYQNGYDARKMMNGELNIFAVEEENTYLAVDATHSLVNTRVGVRTGEETAYTFTFANLRTQEPIALMDNDTEQIIPIAEGTTYTFFATPNTMITNRFVIVANEDNDEGVATDIQNTTIETKLHKFIKDNKLFILKDGILYNAQGQLVSK
ncbi:MAG: hypothetical protein U0L62_05365 [Paludibacteraceae bacterium]|nr:hypothetical protein [Paludibacteraceae bacterium]